MRKVQGRGNELATVLISTYLQHLHWCTTHLLQRYNFFMNGQKGGENFIVWVWLFEFGLSSICDIMSFPIPPFTHFRCSSAKEVQTSLKVERSGGKPFRSESSSCGEYSARKPFPFQCLYLEMQTATEMSDWRKCKKNKQTAYKRVLTLITHLYAVLVSIHRGTIIF